MTPAEERAERENLPVVLLLPIEAGRVMEGNPLIARISDGGEVLVRLITAEEFMTQQHALVDKYGGEPISRGMAEHITRPGGAR